VNYPFAPNNQIPNDQQTTSQAKQPQTTRTMSNPFAAYTAQPANDGWMTTRKTGRDDGAIRKAAEAASEARKMKTRCGAANNGGSKGAGSKGGGRKKKRSFSDEESFIDEEDYEDDFVVHSEEEEGSFFDSEEGDWNSDLEDDDSLDGKKKKKQTKQKGLAKKKPVQKQVVSKRGGRGNRTGKQPVYNVDDSEDGKKLNEVEFVNLFYSYVPRLLKGLAGCSSNFHIAL
jgi:hypothetical protein